MHAYAGGTITGMKSVWQSRSFRGMAKLEKDYMTLLGYKAWNIKQLGEGITAQECENS